MERYFPYEDLIIYEMGAGNGTLAKNVLDYLRDEYPEAYERTRYRIIEISPNLAELQRKKLQPEHACVEVVNKSVFDWDTNVPVPCFFLALEVIVSNHSYVYQTRDVDATSIRTISLTMWLDTAWTTCDHINQ